MALDYVLFVYGSEMAGESDHALLESAKPLGAATTEARFDLIDLGANAALASGGLTAITGEVYLVPVATLAKLDIRAGHPVIHVRTTIRLADGRDAEAYLLKADQVRGRRRIRGGDWKTRSQAERVTDGGPLVRWARGRHGSPGR
jgi:gamma-glutamylcyclotransferase (GGCT)/AIG2-like uncharacterized protein YtfP